MNAQLGKKLFNSTSRSISHGRSLPSNSPALTLHRPEFFQRGGRRPVSREILNLLVQTADLLGVSLRSITQDSETLRLSQSSLVSTYHKYLVALRESTGDENFRGPISFEDSCIFCSCLINCENLAHAITTAINFFKLLNNRWGGLTLRIVNQEAIFCIDMSRRTNTITDLCVDMIGLCFLYKLFSWLIGEPLDATRITLAHYPLLDVTILKEMSDCPVEFGDQTNSIIFREEMLAKPVIRTHQELIETLKLAPFELIPLVQNISLPRRLEKIFEKALVEKSEIPSLEQAASLVGQSSPTLRRHLARAGTSFQELLDKCRMARAINLLLHTNLTLDEISYSLGFSASSGFSRAFKDWTGLSPSNYRHMLSMEKVLATG